MRPVLPRLYASLFSSVSQRLARNKSQKLIKDLDAYILNLGKHHIPTEEPAQGAPSKIRNRKVVKINVTEPEPTSVSPQSKVVSFTPETFSYNIPEAPILEEEKVAAPCYTRRTHLIRNTTTT